MNKRQIIVMWVIIGLVVLISLFPVKNIKNNSYYQRCFLFETRVASLFRDGKVVGHSMATPNYGIYLLQLIPIIAVGIGLIISLKDREQK